MRLTAGITTKNRPQALARCLASLQQLAPALADVVVCDDGSTPPISLASLREGSKLPLRLIRCSGYIAGRDQTVRESATEAVLLLDDDAAVLSPEAVFEAWRHLERDASLGAVAFAQAEADGRRWPAAMQPARAAAPALVPAFIGFAHLVRRSSFMVAGGYRRSLVFYGEEKDFCVRLMDAGFHVLYLPDALVAHIPDPSGRSPRRYVRYAIRNDCLTSLYSEPLPYVLAGLPVRFWRHTRMARRIEGGDPWGLPWLAMQLARELPWVLRGRRAVSYRTMRRWRRLARQPESYAGGDGEALA